MDAIVFGIGNYYKTKKKSIEKQYHVIAYLDGSVGCTEEKEYDDGIKIYNPIHVHELADAPIILMSAKFTSMFERLMELGVDTNRIVLGTAFAPTYDLFEEFLKENHAKILAEEKTLRLRIDEKDYLFRTEQELQEVLRGVYRKKKPAIEIISKLPLTPISRRYGREHGTPVDRYYIEKFLEENKERICGDVAEFADDAYTIKYGQSINKSYILHVNGWGDNVIRANLESGEGIQDEKIDCLICTQVIQFIYDIEAVIHNILRLLKPGGTALITAHGLAQLSGYDYRNWGEYWRFTDKTFKSALNKARVTDFDVTMYGNVKVATALLWGVCIEDLPPDVFEYNDIQYPVVVAARLTKHKG